MYFTSKSAPCVNQNRQFLPDFRCFYDRSWKFLHFLDINLVMILSSKTMLKSRKKSTRYLTRLLQDHSSHGNKNYTVGKVATRTMSRWIFFLDLRFAKLFLVLKRAKKVYFWIEIRSRQKHCKIALISLILHNSAFLSRPDNRRKMVRINCYDWNELKVFKCAFSLISGTFSSKSSNLGTILQKFLNLGFNFHNVGLVQTTWKLCKTCQITFLWPQDFIPAKKFTFWWIVLMIWFSLTFAW